MIRPSRPNLLSAIALATVAASSGLAHAQTSAEKREAKVQIATGMDHYRAGEYREAVRAFRLAFQVLPDAGSGLTWNIARSYEELGDVTNAVHYFGVFLERYPEDRSADEAQRKLGELRPRLPGALIVRCGDGRAATVTVDEDREGACGVKMANLSPGAHPVVVRWGRRTWRGRAEVPAAETGEITVDWSEATTPNTESSATGKPAAARRTAGKRGGGGGWSTTDWLITGGVVAGALVLGAGVAYAVEQPGRVEVPGTTLGERTVLQK